MNKQKIMAEIMKPGDEITVVLEVIGDGDNESCIRCVADRFPFGNIACQNCPKGNLIYKLKEVKNGLGKA